MAEIVSDATDVLYSAFNAFESQIHDGSVALYPRIDSALNTALDELSQIPNHIESFLVGRRIKQSVDGQAFRNSLTALRDSVSTEVSNRLKIVSNDYNNLKSSISTDFNEVVNNAQNNFINLVSSYYITDPDFQTKYTAIQEKMTQAVTDATPLITDHISGNDAKFIAAQADVSSKSNNVLNSFVFNTPVVRNVGNTKVPSSLVSDGKSSNVFSVDLQNISKVPWNGYLGVEFVDEYKKRFKQNGLAGPVFTINPGETKTISRSIIVPATVKVIPTKGKNIGKETPVPWGKNLTYKINVFTRLK